MQKKITFGVLFLAVSAILFTSCNNQTTNSSSSSSSYSSSISTSLPSSSSSSSSIPSSSSIKNEISISVSGPKAVRYGNTIPFGYADGLKRNTTLLGFINGEIIKNVGNIMMNHTLMFSKNKYKIGDEIELIGDNLNINYLSKQYKTIPYEITTSLNPNLKRIIE